jgi:SAM-dependent methyltransferase
VELATFERLLSPSGQRLLDEATTAYDDGALAASTRLASTYPVDLVAAALTQVSLRRRAEVKFGPAAGRMYFTSDGLQQATTSRVAEHRAARIAAGAARSVVDCGCGVGGDLLAFSRAGFTAAGVDRDPVRVAITAANLRALDLPGAVQVADATDLDLAPFDVVYVDPSRRDARGRVFDVHGYAPPWSFVTSLFDRPACVKVAPGVPRNLVPTSVETEWVSFDGDVKEAALWSRYLATVHRRATVIRGTGLATLTDEDDSGGRSVRPVARWLYEPDGAVIRAGLVTAVADRVEGHLLDEHIAYVTSDSQMTTPFAHRYEVLEVLPFRERALRAALRARDVGTLTIKKRGVDVVPEQLRKRLALTGQQAATVVLTRAAGAGVALMVRPENA